MLISIASLSPDDLLEGFQMASEMIDDRHLLDYVYETFLRGPVIRRNKDVKTRRPSKFKSELWSEFDSMEENMDRANNVIGSHHNVM